MKIKREIQKEIKRLIQAHAAGEENYEIEIFELSNIIELDLRKTEDRSKAWRYCLNAAETGNCLKARDFADYFSNYPTIRSYAA